MKIRIRDLRIILVIVVILLLALAYLRYWYLPKQGEGESRCVQCGKAASHRIKLGSWVVGLCEECYRDLETGG